jgi:hypothetical protein
MSNIKMILVIFMLLFLAYSSSEELAFPTAEGYGRYSKGGVGGRLIEVTNLNDTGSGSLRAAIEETGPRIIDFKVGGTIQLRSKLVVKNPYITIDGNAAPKPGITLTNYTFGCLDTHDVIIRYIRIRPGDSTGKTQDGAGAANCNNVIFDHCSISWSTDEGFSSRRAQRITFQHCIISEPLNIAGHDHYAAGKGHGYAASISGNIGSFHHNLIAHSAGRNWSLAGNLSSSSTGPKMQGCLDIRNNVVYNWVHRTNDGGCAELNLVNNYYKPGPATRNFWLLKFDAVPTGDKWNFYCSGNIMEGIFNENDPEQGIILNDPEHIIRMTHEVFPANIRTTSAKQAYIDVLNDVGCNFPEQDPIDKRIIHEVRSGTTTHKGSKSGLPGIIDCIGDLN